MCVIRRIRNQLDKYGRREGFGGWDDQIWLTREDLDGDVKVSALFLG